MSSTFIGSRKPAAAMMAGWPLGWSLVGWSPVVGGA